jgi:hypothetical protein
MRVTKVVRGLDGHHVWLAPGTVLLGSQKFTTMKIGMWAIGWALLAMGCNSSKITTSWKATVVEPSKYQKVMVLALIPDKDRQVQERMEQHFVGDLVNLGYTAFSALQQYGPKAFDNMDEKKALDKMRSSGADAVITIVLLNKEKERSYVPARSYYVGGLWDYFGARQQRIYEPGYYVTDTKYFWESNFYDLSTQVLLYSAQTKSFSPLSTEALGHEYGLLLVGAMRKQKVLENRVQVEAPR